MLDDLVKNNRDVWEDWTVLHVESESDYQQEIKDFEAGACTLSEIDLQEVGEVRDKDLLHLMCHFGLDSLSWAKRGARVTGIDFSSNSIAVAKRFSAAHGIKADFFTSDVYQLPVDFSGKFDIVYTEGGILTWLPDLPAYARVVAGCLKPGGIFYIRDSHPFRRVLFPMVIDGNGDRKYYRYFSNEPTCLDMRGSYAQPNSEKHHTVYFWVHGLGEIITALCDAGFRIEFLHEFPKVYEFLPTAVRTNPGQFEQQVLQNWAIPNTFSLRATLMSTG